MSSPAPHNDAPDPGIHLHLPHRLATRRALLIVAAFAIGLLLFALLWWRDRGNDFYRAQTMPQTAEGQQFEPLPAPLPAGESPGNASGIGAPTPQAAPGTPAPRVVETPPPPPPSVPRPGPTAEPLAPGTMPVPIASPAPAYPPEALRKGESGTVLLRVQVGADGIPVGVDVVESSHSRSLDRAATDAVKRWRFRPAQRDGHAVAGDVQVPIAFNAER